MSNYYSYPTSQKYRNFICEPIGEKPIEDVPGIGIQYGFRLRLANIDKVYKLLGIFLSHGKSRDWFENWLRTNFRVLLCHARHTSYALWEWSALFI